MQTVGTSSLSRLLLLCALAAALLGVFFGFLLNAWSLMGFFFAVAIGAGGISLLFWPIRPDPPPTAWVDSTRPGEH